MGCADEITLSSSLSFGFALRKESSVTRPMTNGIDGN